MHCFDVFVHIYQNIVCEEVLQKYLSICYIFAFKAPLSPSGSQRERESNSSTPGISVVEPATSNKDTKDSPEDVKHIEPPYSDHNRKTPPRADSSDSISKGRPGSRMEASSPYISAHIAHTSQVQQQQRSSQQQQDIYEIGSTHPERFPPYRQAAQYPGQRHPMEHAHGIHREGEPFASERDRPGVSSPPDRRGAAAGFQARAGSPFALVPADRGICTNFSEDCISQLP